ncbi:hypothetical protein U91I_02755 [alpha proteobacterium U9-1i]|nr:hypothetical protein U91I_02755 [alpha proteobacterium U9-1i]
MDPRDLIKRKLRAGNLVLSKYDEAMAIDLEALRRSLTPGDYLAAGVDPPHYTEDPFLNANVIAEMLAAEEKALAHKLKTLQAEEAARKG